jgi:hypothetical protein
LGIRQGQVLEVYAVDDAYPHYLLEVIGPQELWWLYDGWLFRLRARVTD